MAQSREERLAKKREYNRRPEVRARAKRPEAVASRKRYYQANKPVFAQRAREWRRKNPDKVRAANQRSYWRNPEEYRRRSIEYSRARKAVDPEWGKKSREASKRWFRSPRGQRYMKAWRQRPDVQEKTRIMNRIWYWNNRKKVKAHSRVAYALKNGIIRKLPCCICGGLKSEAHHEDYSKPLQVDWYCRLHHRQIHPCGAYKMKRRGRRPLAEGEISPSPRRRKKYPKKIA